MTSLSGTVSRFNSKLVRLKVAVPREPVPFAMHCFNSKLVRLKDALLGALSGIPGFQFQTGAIKREIARRLDAD